MGTSTGRSPSSRRLRRRPVVWASSIEHGDVRSIESTGSGWRLRLADGAQPEADRVIVAASVDTPSLLRPLGADLPIVAENRWLFFSDPIPERLLDPLVVAVDRRFAAKQLADGRVLASDLSAIDADDAMPRRCDAASSRTAVELFPRFEYVALPLLVRGVYDNTPIVRRSSARFQGMKASTSRPASAATAS